MSDQVGADAVALRLREQVASLVRESGYGPDEPVAIAIRQPEVGPLVLTQGRTADGEPLSARTLIYTASLSKQVTAACAALLVKSGALDIDSALSSWCPELPQWAGSVRLRHLVHHTAALPLDFQLDEVMTNGVEANRTSQAVIDALTEFPALDWRPGTDYVYSNAGYVCLAMVVQRAADQPLADYARHHVFGPLSMADTCYWPGPPPAPPGAAPLSSAHPSPLSLGDGGVWSTAVDLLRWSTALNADQLGITELLQTPGSLDDGSLLDYAWGMEIRQRGGRLYYWHGGAWPGVRTLLARDPDAETSLVTFALADETERRVPLANRLLDLLALPGLTPA